MDGLKVSKARNYACHLLGGRDTQGWLVGIELNETIMTVAVCLKCGEFKHGAFTICLKCRYTPDDDESLTRHLLVTDWSIDDARGPRRTAAACDV